MGGKVVFRTAFPARPLGHPRRDTVFPLVHVTEEQDAVCATRTSSLGATSSRPSTHVTPI